MFEKSGFWSKFSKIAILVMFTKNPNLCQTFEKSGFWTKFSKIAILVKIGEKSRFWWRFSKHLDLGLNFLNFRFWSTFLKNLDWCQNFCSKSVKISIWIKIFEISRFQSKLLKKSSFWWKFSKTHDFVHIFEKSQLMSNCRKSGFWSKFSKNSDFGQNCRKYRLWKTFPKSAILVKIRGNFNHDFIRHISILVEISENLDFGQSFWKILIEVKIFEIHVSRF